MTKWNQMRKKYAYITLMLLASLAVIQTCFQTTYAQQTKWSMELIVQSNQAAAKEYIEGVFETKEEIIIVAKVMYNMDPRRGIGVSFEAKGPKNSPHPTTIYRTARTSLDGIAIISFRIPESNQSELDVVGEWQVFAVANTFPEPTKATKTFTVKERSYETSKGKIELSIEKVTDGTLTNQTSNVVAPFDEIKITANVSYNKAHAAGALVMFEVTGPANSHNRITLFRSTTTDQKGVGAINFRIPLNEHPEAILGKWTITASAEVFGDKLLSNITFEVRWPVEISKLRFLNSENEEQQKLTKGDFIIQVSLNSTDLKSREVNVTLDFKDHANSNAVRLEIQNVHVDGNGTVIEKELKIPQEAAFGDASVECNVYSGCYADMPIQVAEAKTAKFLLVNRDLAVTEALLSSNEIYTGDLVSIRIKVENKGTEIEEALIIINCDQILIGNLTTVLAPLKSAELTYIWNTTEIDAGTYDITVKVAPLTGEMRIEDNQVSAGTVTINYPPVNLQAANMFILLIVITGFLTFTLTLSFLRKQSQLHNKKRRKSNNLRIKTYDAGI